ncbi:hypothetical protein GCM10027270_23880 [Nocardioides ginkgobilobae]
MLALLRDLETVGFADAPRVVGDGYAPDGQMGLAGVGWEEFGDLLAAGSREDMKALVDKTKPGAKQVQCAQCTSRFGRYETSRFALTCENGFSRRVGPYGQWACTRRCTRRGPA